MLSEIKWAGERFSGSHLLQGCFTCTRTAGDGEHRAKFLSVSLIPVNMWRRTYIYMGWVLPSVPCPKITNLSLCTDKLYNLLLVNTNRAPKRGVAIYRSKSLNAPECEKLNGSVFQECVWCNFTSTNEEKVLIGRIYKSPILQRKTHKNYLN